MKKHEIDLLIQNIWIKCFYKTVESCRKQWNIDFKGKDKHLGYPFVPELPDTQEEVVKAIKEGKL